MHLFCGERITEFQAYGCKLRSLCRRALRERAAAAVVAKLGLRDSADNRGGLGGREHVSEVRSLFDSTQSNPDLKNLDYQISRARVREPRTLQHVLDDLLQAGALRETIHSSSQQRPRKNLRGHHRSIFTQRSALALMNLFTAPSPSLLPREPRSSSVIGR